MPLPKTAEAAHGNLRVLPFARAPLQSARSSGGVVEEGNHAHLKAPSHKGILVPNHPIPLDHLKFKRKAARKGWVRTLCSARARAPGGGGIQSNDKTFCTALTPFSPNHLPLHIAMLTFLQLPNPRQQPKTNGPPPNEQTNNTA